MWPANNHQCIINIEVAHRDARRGNDMMKAYIFQIDITVHYHFRFSALTVVAYEKIYSDLYKKTIQDLLELEHINWHLYY